MPTGEVRQSISSQSSVPRPDTGERIDNERMEQLLRMEGIAKSFFGVSVLKGVDFDLDHGEVHVLLGENGAGKSTLMKILSGAYQLEAGSIILDGQKLDLSSYSPKTAEDLGIVTIYQNFHLIPHLSVAENLSLSTFTHGRGLIDWGEVYAHAGEVLSRIDFKIDLKARVRDLPVSQKQMLEIAIALSKNAKVIIMDEPTAALSRKETETLFKTIADVKARGIGIIYISHKLEEVKLVGDRITVLRDGAKIATVAAKDADLGQIISLMIGKEVSRNRQFRETSAGVELLRVEGLSNHNFSAPVSFAVRNREILGVTGLVGAGKSELARAIFGVDKLTSGAAFLAGRQVRIESPRRAVKLGVGYLPEDRDSDGLCLNLGVKENVSLVLLSKLKGLLFSVASEKHTVSGLVDSMAIKTAGLSQQVKYLSGGNKQKVVFAKWLCARCNVLVLDEPTIGIDVGARGDIYDLIQQFVSDENRAVIFISSDIDEVLEVADRILVMSGGALVAELDPNRTTKQEIMQYSLQAFAGRAEE
jgi:ribose transport system ATP-binding protein